MSSLKQQSILSVLFTIINTGLLFASVVIAENVLPPAYLGVVLLFRRKADLFSNLIQLGMSNVVFGFYTREKNLNKRTRILLSVAIILVSSFLLVFLIQAISFIYDMGFVYSGVDGWLFLIYIYSLALGHVVVSIYLAELRIVIANIINLSMGSLIFIVSLSAYSIYGIDVIVTLAALSIAFSFLVIASIGKKNKFYKASELQSCCQLENIKQYISFGVFRSISSLLDIALFLIGPWFLEREPKAAGSLIISYMLFKVFLAGILPISKLVAIRAVSDISGSVRHLKLLSYYVLGLSIGVSLLANFFGDPFIKYFFPSSYASISHFLESVIWTLPGVCLFYSLKNYLDMNYKFPISLVVFSLALLTYIVTNFLSEESDQYTRAITSTLNMFLTLNISSAFLFYMVFRKKVINDRS